ncbi:cytochrome b [Moraxella sp. ZJ142]|uniref:cytochrome b n=1 Tax=Moraxella marmotae TaxID=3344520 RepID=UPI0035D429E6
MTQSAAHLSKHNSRHSNKYNLAARIFHWIGALLILAAWIIIEQGDDYISLHKSVGFSFLIWTLLRITNRVFTKAPPPPPMSALQAKASLLVHLLLYVAMVAMPLTGFLASMYAGYGVNVFGVLPIAGVAVPNELLADTLMGLHKGFIWPLLLGLVGVHILGALHHQFILKDNLIARMR